MCRRFPAGGSARGRDDARGNKERSPATWTVGKRRAIRLPALASPTRRKHDTGSLRLRDVGRRRETARREDLARARATTRQATATDA